MGVGRIAAVLLAMASPTAALAAAPPAKAPSPLEGGETKDRLPPEALREMVRRPAAAVSAGDVARAEREFDVLMTRLRAREGDGGLVVADTLVAFAVVLYEAEHKRLALAYFRRAADAYRIALGPDDPEVAVSLHDIANVELDLSPDTASPELIATVEEALRIRRLALGLNNAETAVTFILLGRVKGMAAGGDPQRVEEALGLVRFGIECLPMTPNADPTDVASGYYRLAEVYARNGRGGESLTAAGIYWDTVRPLDALTPLTRIQTLVDILHAHGDPAAAETLAGRYLTEANRKALLDAVMPPLKAP
jgi:hypothetical protein